MAKPSFDPGLTQQYTGNLRRAINKDGSFNVERRGTSWRHLHTYLYLINVSWPIFLSWTLAAYIVANTIFAVVYFLMGPGHVQGADAATAWDRFLNDFFFSAHTLTTVGYGTLAPLGFIANSVAAFEAMTGLMGFALATGLLFGRFSKPSARIGFSENALIAPYQGGQSLQFRIVNLRSNVLLELQARVMLMTVEGPPGEATRRFKNLTLERDDIYFFPLTWTVVHPIDEASPFFGKSAADLEKLQAEVLILLKGFDDTFSQTVNVRYSYRYDELVWGARFQRAFRIDEGGRMVLELNRVGEHIREKASEVRSRESE